MINKPEALVFSNRPNQVFFNSRSVAVLVVPFFRLKKLIWVPLGQRSEKVSDPGKWCVPCGYLDWDESGREAAIREAYEELGLDLRQYIYPSPWYVQSDPSKDARQNVTLRYYAYCECDELPELTFDAECISAEWREVEAAISSTDLAFNQAKIIEDLYQITRGNFSCQPYLHKERG